jgi:hypothetical protein
MSQRLKNVAVNHTVPSLSTVTLELYQLPKAGTGNLMGAARAKVNKAAWSVYACTDQAALFAQVEQNKTGRPW